MNIYMKKSFNTSSQSMKSFYIENKHVVFYVFRCLSSLDVFIECVWVIFCELVHTRPLTRPGNGGNTILT